MSTGGAPPVDPAASGAAEPAHLDVRPLVSRGEEPFPHIMAAVRALRPGQALLLHAPFEPQPLYEVMRRRGFAHRTEHGASGEVVVCFYPDAAAPAGRRAPAATSAAAGPRARTLDVRGLPPPQPMLQVLEAMETLEPGEQLEVLHERRPALLYPLLDERGLPHTTDEPEPGLVRIVIERPAARA